MFSSQKHLVNCGAFDTSSSFQIMMKEFIPLVDDYSSKKREKINTLEKNLDSVLSSHKQQFIDFFQFIQGLTMLWTSHETAEESARRQFMVRFRATVKNEFVCVCLHV